MKILLLHDYPPPGAGAENQFLSLRNELRKRGHDARLFTSTAGKQQSLSDYECFGTTSGFRTLLQTYNISAYRSLKKVLADFRPDVVQTNIYLTQLSPLILELLRGFPSLYYAVWFRSICPIGTKMLPDKTICFYPAGAICRKTGCLPLRDWVPLMYQRKMQRRGEDAFDLIVAVSHYVKQRLCSEGVPATDVNWPGVSIPTAPGRRSDFPLVVFAGRLVKEKGADVLLQAFAQVKRTIADAELLIAGDGTERLPLENLAARLEIGSSVKFLGKLLPEQVQREFAPAWIQVVPSVWPEPLPVAAMEGMMRGSVVVASNTGGLPEIIQDSQNGFLFEPQNVSMLADILKRLLSNPESVAKIGAAAHQFALNHLTEDKSVDRFIALYERALQMHHEGKRHPEQ